MIRRLAPLVAALAVIAALLAPSAADAAPANGTVSVQLQTAQGALFKKPGFVVTVNGLTTGLYKEATTNSAGVATFSLPATKYVFHVATYRTDYRYAVVGSSTVTVTAGAATTLKMRMYLGGQVGGTVKLSTGKPLAYGTIAVASASGQIAATSTTNAKGVFHVSGVPTGSYVVVFNYRSWADPKVAAVANFGWGYYRGTTLENAALVKVTAQTATKAAGSVTGINGTVKPATKVTFSLATAGDAKTGQVQIERFRAAGEYIGVDSVYGPLAANGRGAVAQVHAGYRYRLGVTYNYVRYYFTGQGTTLTTDATKAVLLTFSGASVTVRFGPKPSS